MIVIISPSEKFLDIISYLKTHYSNYIIEYTNNNGNKVVEISRGIPIILKYYGFDHRFRIELGSYLSELITACDYVSIEIY